MFRLLKNSLARFVRQNRRTTVRKSQQRKPTLDVLEDRLALSLASSVSAVGGIKDFYIDGHSAYLRDSQGLHLLADGAKSISAVQDLGGYARAAIVLDNGQLWDYFDYNHMLKYEASNVKDASAGYDFDAVLYGSGWFKDCAFCKNPYTTQFIGFVASNVASISAGEDRDFLPLIAYVDNTFNAFEWRLGNTSWVGYTESLGANVSQVSAGWNGVTAVLYSFVGLVENHTDAPYATYGGKFTSNDSWHIVTLGTGAVAISAGTDRNGAPMTDVLFANHSAKEYSSYSPDGALEIGYGIVEIDAGHDGISDVVTPAIGSFPLNDVWRFQDAWPGYNGFWSEPSSWTVVVNYDNY